MRAILLCFGLVLIFCAIIRPGSPPSERFFSLNGRFEIGLPLAYTNFKPNNGLRAANQDYSVDLFEWSVTPGLFSVGFARGKIDLEDNTYTEAFLNDFRKLYLKRKDSSIVSETAAPIAEHKGFRLVAQSPGAVTIIRLVLARNRFYMLTVAAPPDQRDLLMEGEKVLLSFRFLNPSEIVEKRQRLLKRFVINELPQLSSTQTPKSDTYNDDLKGKVRSTLIEREVFCDGKLFEDTLPSESMEYDQRGQLTRQIRYVDGVPLSVLIFGYINDERVFRKYSLATGPFRVEERKDFASTTLIPAETMSRIVQVYESSGLLKEQTIYEGKKLVEQESYKYEAGKREVATVNIIMFPKESFEDRWKTTELLDEKGNVLEEIRVQYLELPDNYYSDVNPMAHPSGGKIHEKAMELRYRYAYDFDSQGNWIKRIASSVTKEKGKIVVTPISVEYRRIDYFQN